MLPKTLNGHPLTEKHLFGLLFSLGFSAFPLLALTVAKGYRAIPLLLVLLALVALIRGYRSWSPDMTRWAWALGLLTAPLYLGYVVGAVEAPNLERISYGWLFLLVGAAACRARPNRRLFVGALILGAFLTLAGQVASGRNRPSLDFNPIPFAEVAAAFFCLLCVSLCFIKRRLWVLAIVAGLIGWLVVIVLTETRGAMLATLPGLIFLVVHLGKRFEARVSLGILLVIGGVGWIGDSLTERVISQRFVMVAADVRQYRENPEIFSSTAVRLELWRSALMLVREYPMGQGEDGARETALEWLEEGRIQKYLRPQFKVAHFHSDFFQQLAVTGYLGVVALVLLYSLLIHYCFIHRQQMAGSLGLVFTLSYIVSGLTDVPLYNRLTLFTFFLVLTFCFVSLKHPLKLPGGDKRSALAGSKLNP